jgi:hypothetical protein
MSHRSSNAISKNPRIVVWRLETASARDLKSLERILRPVEDLDFTYSDQVVTATNEHETTRTVDHRLGDYFELLCILPKARGDSPSIRLFFQCKSNIGRFWKDVMASVLKRARESNVTTSIAIDYRIDDEDLCAVATQVPKWFSLLGDGSRKFWELSARYLLKHAMFTFEDLARETGVPQGSLKAMHRNSYRAIKREESPNPLWSRWDYALGRTVYTMDPVVRDEILCITTQAKPIPKRRVVA